MSSDAPHPDTMNALAGIAPGSALADLRAQRPDIVSHMQASENAILRPAIDAGLTAAERAAVALRIATLLRDARLAAHYRVALAKLDAADRLADVIDGRTPADPRLATVLAHADRLTRDPDAAAPEHLAALATAGLSKRAIIALSQVIAYVNYQARALAGLRMLGGRT